MRSCRCRPRRRGVPQQVRTRTGLLTRSGSSFCVWKVRFAAPGDRSHAGCGFIRRFGGIYLRGFCLGRGLLRGRDIFARRGLRHGPGLTEWLALLPIRALLTRWGARHRGRECITIPPLVQTRHNSRKPALPVRSERLVEGEERHQNQQEYKQKHCAHDDTPHRPSHPGPAVSEKSRRPRGHRLQLPA